MGKISNVISLEDCLTHFYYDDFGHLYWKIDISNRRKNTLAGNLHKLGYYKVDVNYKSYKSHRILYQMYHNVTLKEDEYIDHIDGNKQNNKKENLRVCTRSENHYNRKVQNNNLSTGIKNISIKSSGHKAKYYEIRIKKDKKLVFDEWYRCDVFTLDDVIKIRNEQLKLHHGEFHNLG